MNTDNASFAFLLSPEGEVVAKSPSANGLVGDWNHPPMNVEHDEVSCCDETLTRFWTQMSERASEDVIARLVSTLESFPLRNAAGSLLGTVCVARNAGAPLEAQDSESMSDARLAEQVAIFALSLAAEWRDQESGEHFRRIRSMTRLIAEEVRQEDEYRQLMDEKYLIALFNAALIHDIGKLAIPDSVLKKRGRLTPREMDLMRSHTVIGANILREIRAHVGNSLFIRLAEEVVLSHHENLDGSGYPHGIKGDEIPISARIVGVADVYDAIHAKRCYKDRVSHEDTVKIILAERGRKFDPVVVDAFMRIEHTIKELQEVWDATDNAYAEILKPFHDEVDAIMGVEAAAV